MRRSPVFVVLLAMLLFAAPVAAFAEDAAAPETVVLAAEADDPVGPVPAERTAEDNAARELAGYENQDLPYTWGAAWILSFAGLVGLVLLGGLYQLLVRGPAQKSDH